MTKKMPNDLMRYDLMARNALRGVVRAALEHARAEGLPGEHHFYIAFATKAPGVQISDRLHEKYDDEMTIVLQHQYWDLEVREDFFSVNLSFNNIPEKLVVPYAAINSFYDPSVQFGLQFQDEVEGLTIPEDAVPTPKTAKKPANKPKTKTKPKAKSKAKAKKAPSKEDADVVSLDAFRKKKGE